MQCVPISQAWGPAISTCARFDLFMMLMVISVFGLLTDVIILLLPLPVVLRLQTDTKRKGKAFVAPSPFHFYVLPPTFYPNPRMREHCHEVPVICPLHFQ